MKKVWYVILLTFLISMSICTNGLAVVTSPTDVNKASSGCRLEGIRGRYIVDSQNALKRLNAIRLEACKEGVKDPATGKKLTVKDYVPLKWSSDMEYIARIRAAEASITQSHKRANGKAFSTLKSKKGYASNCEIIAGNNTASVMSGIEQWYNEKKAYVKKTKGETGHYEAIISTKVKYIGIATFYSKATPYYNTTVGEFSVSTKKLDQTMGKAVSDVIQKIEVTNAYYKKYQKVFLANIEPKTENTMNATLKKGQQVKLNITTNATVKSKITYATSNKSVVTVNTQGVMKALKAGKATITAQMGTSKTIIYVVVK